MKNDGESESLVIGDWHVTPSRLICTSNGRSVRLQPKHMDVLVELARCAPDLVSRSALIERVWPRGFVDPNVLNNAVSALRKNLDAPGQTLLETVPRRGYRLTVPVTQDAASTTKRWSRRVALPGLKPLRVPSCRCLFRP